jgi:tetratricopeptide (TPR) repeat protein
MRPPANAELREAAASPPTESLDVPAARLGSSPERRTDPRSPGDGWMIGLLHSFRIERNGQVVKRFQGRIVDGLLAYLALQPTRAHGRAEIARQFWPQRTQKVALRRLSHVLFSLSRVLKDLGLPEDAIIADYYTLQLSPEIDTDLRRLDLLLSRAKQDPDPVECRAGLEAALDMYGDGVLPTMNLPWVRSEQDRLAQRLAQLREDLFPGTGSASPSDAPGATTALDASSHRVSSGLTPEMDLGADMAPLHFPMRRVEQDVDERLSKARELADWLERLEPHLLGSDRMRWIQQINDRDTEVQLVTDWALSSAISRRDPDLALRLVAALWRYWYLRSLVRQGRAYAEQVLLSRPAVVSMDYARAVYAAGSLALCSSDPVSARAWLESSLQLSRQLGDERLQSRCRASLGVVAYQEGNLCLARELLTEGAEVFRTMGEQVLLAGALHNAALVELDDGDLERASTLLQDYMGLGHRLGDQTILANGLVTLGTLAGLSGSWEKVSPLVARARPLFEAQGDLNGIALCLRYQAYVAMERGEDALARVYIECSLSICRALSDLPGISDTLSLLAEILEKQGRVTDALALYREAWQQLGTTGHQKRLASPAMDRGLARAPGVTVGILR